MTLEQTGYAIIARFLNKVELSLIIEAVNQASAGRHAIRNLLNTIPEVKSLTHSPTVRNLIEPILGPHCFPVRGLLFDDFRLGTS